VGLSESEKVCSHENFDARADVSRIQKSELEPQSIVAYMMDLGVFCHECGLQFDFLGLPNGFSYYQPTVSIDEKTAHLPICPPGQPPPRGMPGYSVTATVFDDREATKQ
jgi:hypothetical protein